MRTMICLSAAALLLCACAQHYEPGVQPREPMAAAELQPDLANQPAFTSPEEAVTSLYKASKANDLRLMSTIVGLPLEDVTTGDKAKDAELAARFAAAYDEFHRIVPDPNDPSRARVFIGKENYPLASPLVRTGDTWVFDSAGGKQELLSRVVGENELNTIGVCRAYVQAQYEYYSEDRNGDDVLQYAQHLASSSGTHDGLYWRTDADQPESPLGPLVAEARAAGFIRGSARSLDVPKPYHGYLFQVLTEQGPKAAGGEYSYIVNGRMIAGFALVAFPAKYGKSGVMTFEVGANGKVYQKDLGAETPDAAGVITKYDPDSSWTFVQD